jgi:hypothetical protein
MKTDPQDLLLLVGGAGFAVFLLLKVLTALGRDGTFRETRRRVLEAKKRGSDRSLPASQRAAALREAANAALEGLGRPALAAALARRAERLDPSNPDVTSLLALALRRGARYSALERCLWRQLADSGDDTEAKYAKAFDELVALYEGPLQRPETARALRRFRPAVVPGSQA